MFKHDLSSLICPICEQIFTKPMVLPCNKTLCSYCITAIVLEKPDTYQCLYCNQWHNLTENTLTINEPLNAILNSITDDFKQMLQTIELSLNKLEFNLNNSDLVIKEYCDDLRRKVQYATTYQLQTENIDIEKLFETNDQMLSQITVFESNKIRTFIKSEQFSLMLKPIRKFCEKWKNINEFVLDTKLFDFIYNLEAKLNIESDNLNGIIFGNETLKLIGKELQLCSMDTIDYNHLKKVELLRVLNKIKNANKNESVTSFKFTYSGSGCLNNGQLVIALLMTINRSDFEQSDYSLLLFHYDKSRTLIKWKQFHNITSCNMLVHLDHIVLDCTWSETLKESIQLKDTSFKTLKELKTRNQPLIALNDSFIFCLNKDSNRKSPLVLYNYSLQMVKSIGQRMDPTDCFYLSNDIIYFEAKYGKYYIIEKRRQCLFKIIDELSGIVLYSIELNEDYELFVATNINKIILYNPQTISFINPSGSLLKQVKLSNFPLKMILIYDNCNNLLCFNETIHL